MPDRIGHQEDGRIDQVRASLTASRGPLAKEYDVALLDLDGVVYVGPEAVPGVPDALHQVREAGMRLAFVTNNAARTPASVAEHLRDLSVPADPAEVITSAQAAAHYLADRLPAGAPVLVVGTTGLTDALQERGLVPVQSADEQPAAVVQGYSPDLTWKQLAEGAVAIRRGVAWVATNLDPTVPSPRGPLPGNGSLVAALRHATGAVPVATGKPDPTMHRESVQRSGAKRPIVVGDRLDTDVEGAAAVGCPSLLVLSGVTSARELIEAAPKHRPDYVAHTAAGLLSSHPGSEGAAKRARCGGWEAAAAGTELVLRRTQERGADSDDGLDALRALCAASWQATDGRSGGTAGARRITGDGDAAEQVLRELGLG